MSGYDNDAATVGCAGCFAVMVSVVLNLLWIAALIYGLLTLLWYFDVRVDQFTPFWI